jgi:fermentation-respiration switch protein FrsA (DUF1100 family)
MKWVIIGLLLALLAAVWFGQRVMLFPAAWLPDPAGHPRGEPVRFTPGTREVESIFLPPAEGTAEPFPLLIFAHGNGELADDWVDGLSPVRAWGFGVLLFEYPGYGRRSGTPSQIAIERDIVAAWDWAVADPRIDRSRIVAHGRSLGGAAASHLAAHRPIAALILESAFTSVRPLAASYFLPGWLVRDPFDNLAALARYRGPLLVLHGTNDGLVPVGHGRSLSAAVEGAELREQPCGHNDCPPPWDIVRDFLRRRIGVPTR